METNKLRLLYIIAVEEYVAVFCKKHEVDFDGWVGEHIGGVGCFGDYFFNFEDIRYDIDNDVRKSTILKWYNDDLEHNRDRKEPQHINYSSYCKGLRYKDLNKKRRLTKSEKEDLAKTQERIDAIREEIKQEANNI